MIEQFYLTDRWDPNIEGNGNEGVLHILQTPGLKPRLQMQFSVITGHSKSSFSLYDWLSATIFFLHP